MKMLLCSFMASLSFLMFFLNHPLSMGLVILIQTLITCIMLGMLIKTYWFSYILFLTFLGGLLVLFIYVSSIASNEMFNLSMKMKLFIFFSIFISLIFNFMFINNLSFMNLINNDDMINFFNYYLFFNNEYKINMTKLYNNQTFLMMMMLIIYLFITLIAVVKITNIFFGPIRSSNN
uniref:NADH-ubiquinone oxidoreductase chain 6 n=1 Tax=Dichomeris ustalella TaxID=1280432 RepID=A0A142CH56_9NEOP|nr:NADH dehydrogenase subunit 6 [Dichomeris ustalella]AMP87963.1 NADH dehydrogenase subunit 6 [Dichomeris ustalella]